MAYLDNNGVTYLWGKIKTLFNKGITNLSVSGRTITYTKGDGTTGTIQTQDTDTTYSDFKGATASADGGNGLVPAPTKGNEGKYLKADGTWGTPANTTYSDMKGATTSAAGTHGLAPAPAAGEANRYLRSDGTWQVPPNTDTKYTHPTGSGYNHIPAGGSSGQILRWSADGTAVWDADNDTTYNDFTGATTGSGGMGGTAGTHGLVPAPAARMNDCILFGDANWKRVSWGDTVDSGGYLNVPLRFQTPGASSYLGVTLKLAGATSSKMGLLSKSDKTKLDALPTNDTLSDTYAKKSEITNMYKYCGSVTGTAKLPTTGQRVGDVYNIETASEYGGAGMNVAWNGTDWDPLGEIFTITAITNAELDKLCV